jgi:hypothetical protein
MTSPQVSRLCAPPKSSKERGGYEEQTGHARPGESKRTKKSQ